MHIVWILRCFSTWSILSIRRPNTFKDPEPFSHSFCRAKWPVADRIALGHSHWPLWHVAQSYNQHWYLIDLNGVLLIWWHKLAYYLIWWMDYPPGIEHGWLENPLSIDDLFQLYIWIQFGDLPASQIVWLSDSKRCNGWTHQNQSRDRHRERERPRHT